VNDQLPVDGHIWKWGRRVGSTSPLPHCGSAGGDALRRLLGDRLNTYVITVILLGVQSFGTIPLTVIKKLFL